jgi:hypothetical protein
MLSTYYALTARILTNKTRLCYSRDPQRLTAFLLADWLSLLPTLSTSPHMQKAGMTVSMPPEHGMGEGFPGIFCENIYRSGSGDMPTLTTALACFEMGPCPRYEH